MLMYSLVVYWCWIFNGGLEFLAITICCWQGQIQSQKRTNPIWVSDLSTELAPTGFWLCLPTKRHF